MGKFSSNLNDFFLGLVENQIFLLICYAVFAIALFTYLYTGLLICQQRGCSPKKKVCLSEICKLNCGSENWLIATEPQQSPLNIVDRIGQYYVLEELIWVNHDVVANKMALENNGEMVILHALFDKSPSVKGASLEKNYTFVNIRFRWGPSSCYGADHMLNNQNYPLEMQVMYTISEDQRVLPSHELLMIAFVFESGNFNEDINTIIESLGCIRQPNTRSSIEPFALGAIVPTCRGGFYCYIGTMTSPPYYEGVKWLVYSKPVSISGPQLREFRILLGADLSPIRKIGRLPQTFSQ